MPSLQDQSKRVLYICLLVALAAATRLLPHAWNFTPVIAMLLFGTAFIRSRALAVALPLAAYYLSDLVLNNFVWAEAGAGWTFSIYWPVYLTFGLIAILGFVFLRGHRLNALRLAGTGLGACLAFFLITNAWVWLASGMYAPDFSGLIASYTAAIPFFGGTVGGTAFFGAILFGSAYAMGWQTAGQQPALAVANE